jgi:5-methyltetrahydrofolate--homocysteine methyltransferase
MNIFEALNRLLQERILIFDGAMGTMIQRHELDEEAFRGERFAAHASSLRGNNDLLVLTQPHIIEAIHTQYLEAGADVIETNSFNANAISQGDYGLEAIVYDLNVAAAQVARRAVDKYSSPERPRFVAGAMGPTTKTLTPIAVDDSSAHDLTFDQMVGVF